MAIFITCPCGEQYKEKIVDILGVQIRSRCPACDGDPKGTQKGRETALAALDLAEKVARNTRLALIPPRFEDSTLENYDISVSQNAEVAYFYAAQYCDKIKECVEGGVSMIFAGTHGTGKTHLGISILKKALGIGLTGQFISARNIPLGIKDTYHQTKSELGAIREFVTPQLLIIDELRQEDVKGPNSDWGRGKLFAVLDERYLAKKATIITSNITRELVRECLTAEGLDRLLQGKLKERMPIFDWESYRK
tara:strand:- start:3250 stop:4002 length:753 start_codon:yes stop_codon:yes gene_type:complete